METGRPVAGSLWFDTGSLVAVDAMNRNWQLSKTRLLRHPQ